MSEKPKRPRTMNRALVFACVSEYTDNRCRVVTDHETDVPDAKRLRDWLEKYLAWREAKEEVGDG